METWLELEQRFCAVSVREHRVVMDFVKRDAETFWYTLSLCRRGTIRITVVGQSGDGTGPEPSYSTAHYSITELAELFRRAGRLLNIERCQTESDIVAGDRFVALMCKRYRALAVIEGSRTCFADAAHIAALTAGYLSANSGRQNTERLVTAREVSEHLRIHRTSLSPMEVDWPEPHIRGRGNKPSQWIWDTLRPVLEHQYPKEDWSSF